MDLTMPSVGVFKDVAVFLGFASFLAVVIVHIAFAIGIWISASTRTEKNGGGVHFVPPFVWSLATLLGGVFVATAYWIIHISELNPRSRETTGAS